MNNLRLREATEKAIRYGVLDGDSILIVAARRVLGFPSPQAVERAIKAFQDGAAPPLQRVPYATRVRIEAALVAAATTDFGKETDGD